MSSHPCCSWCKQRKLYGCYPPISHFPKPVPEKTRQIVHIDADINGSIIALIKLIKEREGFSRQRNTLIPAVNLPPEVLVMIFQFACFSKDSDNDVHVASLFHWPFKPISRLYKCACRTTPSLISRVCSVWRNIAMETSQLWSDIQILLRNKNSDMQAAKLRFWISKSGKRPLTVSLEDNNADIHTSFIEVLDILVANAHRIHTLELLLPCTWAPALTRIAQCLPQLTSLTLRRSTQNSLQRIDFFASAPQLREVSLVDYSTANTSLPLALLERLDVVTTSKVFSGVDECLDRLRLCPRLHRCLVELNYNNSLPVTPAPTPMTHIALETIELLVHSPTQAQIQAFLGALTLPSLRSFSLWLRGRPGERSQGIPSLLPFLLRSAGKLETLCLATTMPLEEELLECLRVLPRLRKLVLKSHAYTDMQLTQRTLDLMNPNKYEFTCEDDMELVGQDHDNGTGMEVHEQSTMPCLAPNLEMFYYQGPIESTPHALVEFLASRWHGPSRCTSGHVSAAQPVKGPEARIVGEQPPSRMNSVPWVRLRSVAFRTEVPIHFEEADVAILQRLQQEGMDLIF